MLCLSIGHAMAEAVFRNQLSSLDCNVTQRPVPAPCLVLFLRVVVRCRRALFNVVGVLLRSIQRTAVES